MNALSQHIFDTATAIALLASGHNSITLEQLERVELGDGRLVFEEFSMPAEEEQEEPPAGWVRDNAASFAALCAEHGAIFRTSFGPRPAAASWVPSSEAGYSRAVGYRLAA